LYGAFAARGERRAVGRWRQRCSRLAPSRRRARDTATERRGYNIADLSWWMPASLTRSWQGGD